MLDDLLRDKVILVANEQLVDALDGVPVNLLQPLLDVRESVWQVRDPSVDARQGPTDRAGWMTKKLTIVGDVVNDNDAVRTAVVRRGDCPEALLACIDNEAGRGGRGLEGQRNEWCALAKDGCSHRCGSEKM